ncbi:hypothetical protein GCM10007276_12030 [Agaricicola taiwanensis]|uniref:Uncharacterized protein n=1 Tax=Agaricicola taiwanensis TaxID=591372 RepID=A0A8J2YC95_9RHOB|nr:hypothetical protein [Agaricicola taiwanensis]GGE36151.1 hypothetical protein GCM10007276_12030 [Agaricicola taiwanensis]
MTSTPAIDFINHKPSKERAMDRALSAINQMGQRRDAEINALRLRHLAGAFGDRKKQIRALLDGHHYMISALLNYRFHGKEELTSDACLAHIRLRIRNAVEARRIAHWTYDRNKEIALRNAYDAVRLMRFSARSRSLNLVDAE